MFIRRFTNQLHFAWEQFKIGNNDERLQYYFSKDDITELRWYLQASKRDIVLRLNAAPADAMRFETTGYVVKITDIDNQPLGVAHLDTVKQWKYSPVFGTRIYNPALDDRLGVFTLMYYLPKYYGIRMNILLTDDEEIGKSTAKNFVNDFVLTLYQRFPYIVEFDRHGTNHVALYQYADNYWSKYVKDAMRVEAVVPGLVSDISYMGALGTKAMNVAIGYYDEHGDQCYADLIEYYEQIRKFAAFYDTSKGYKFAHAYRPNELEAHIQSIMRS